MKYWWGAVFSLFWLGVQSQTIQGTVLESSKGAPVTGAVVGVLNTTTSVVTDDKGKFTLNAGPDDTLIISSLGYKSDTVAVNGNSQLTISLNALELKEVEVTDRKATRLELNAQTVEVLNSSDIVKDACCTLAETFDNTTTVDVTYSDAVSGAKEIRMLGLDGVYTQIMLENIPAIRGMANTFGLNYIPGPWMSSIYLNKGAGSVVNGYESMTGQINVEIKKPLNADKFFLNGYLNQDLRAELNIISATKISERWSTLSAAHGQLSMLKVDYNKDGYLDNPLVKNLNLFNRFIYQSHKVFAFWSAITVNLEDRLGGSIRFEPSENRWTQNHWGVRLKTQRVDAFFKTAFNLPKGNFIGIQYKYFYHHQSGYIGRKVYDGGEHFGYLNFIYQKNLNEKEDALKFGASAQVDRVSEVLDSFQRKRLEIVPGVFAEGTFCFGRQKAVTIVGGVRGDYHNLYRFFITPRLNLKWNIIPDVSLRVGGGRGYRVPTIFAENFGLLSSNREITIDPQLKFEEAWNYGASLNYKFNIDFRPGLVSVDYFRTDFIRQLVVDLENTRELNFYSLDGHSFANAVQAEVSYEVIKRFDVKLAYKYEQTKTDYRSGRKIIPLRPQHRGLVSLEYVVKAWRFNSSLNWFGKTRIPDTSPNDEINRRPLKSKDFFQLNAQITVKIKGWEIYFGGENLLNFMQRNPIINGDQSFSNQFDASLIWGPMRGAMAFAGFRVALK